MVEHLTCSADATTDDAPCVWRGCCAVVTVFAFRRACVSSRCALAGCASATQSLAAFATLFGPRRQPAKLEDGSVGVRYRGRWTSPERRTIAATDVGGVALERTPGAQS